MINTIFKPKGSRIWRWKFRLCPTDGKIQDLSLGTSDKQAAGNGTCASRDHSAYGHQGYAKAQLIYHVSGAENDLSFPARYGKFPV